MIERFLHHVRVELPPVDETSTAARDRLREKFPRQAVRRMTQLGLLVGSTLDGLALGPDDALVYASTFAETRALEDFLTSFPAASPQLFQTSIHPSAVQQVLIGRQQSIARLWPLAGGTRLVEQALLTALLESAPRVVLTGGEERGTWMLEQSMASPRSFAFGLLLTTDPTDALGSIAFSPAPSAFGVPASAGQLQHRLKPELPTSFEDICPSLETFARSLADRRPLDWRNADGTWKLSWR